MLFWSVVELESVHFAVGLFWEPNVNQLQFCAWVRMRLYSKDRAALNSVWSLQLKADFDELFTE